MGLAQDLLSQAEHLLSYEGVKPSQASLRRSVSTAYYALFHLLIEDAATRWIGTPEARTAMERGFKHGTMRSVSLDFGASGWTDRRGHRHVIPSELRNVAKSFVLLQEARHTADYDNSRGWSEPDVVEWLTRAQGAFEDWKIIRQDPMAGNYLIAMLLGK